MLGRCVCNWNKSDDIFIGFVCVYPSLGFETKVDLTRSKLPIMTELMYLVVDDSIMGRH